MKYLLKKNLLKLSHIFVMVPFPVQVIAMTGNLERQAGDQRGELRQMRSDMLHRMSMLEDRQKGHMAEWREALDNHRANIDHYLERMEAKFKAMIDKATAGWADLMVGRTTF